jgi:hypothetical protein
MISDAPSALTNAKAATAPPLSYTQHNTTQHNTTQHNSTQLQVALNRAGHMGSTVAHQQLLESGAMHASQPSGAVDVLGVLPQLTPYWFAWQQSARCNW